MTKGAPSFSQTFYDQIAAGLGFASMEEFARVIALGKAVNDVVGVQPQLTLPGMPGTRFEKVLVDGKHVITRDRLHGIEWDVTDFGGKRFEFEAAKKACAELRTAGHADWRLPTIHELLSLVDYERAEPACDKEFFPNTNTDYYYRTSTPYKPVPGFAWGVVFSNGRSLVLSRGGDYCVRAVRASQS